MPKFYHSTKHPKAKPIPSQPDFRDSKEYKEYLKEILAVFPEDKWVTIGWLKRHGAEDTGWLADALQTLAMIGVKRSEITVDRSKFPTRYRKGGRKVHIAPQSTIWIKGEKRKQKFISY